MTKRQLDAERLNWGKFFWRDWLSDLELRQCSPAARGVWMDMLCVAAQNVEHPGYVMLGDEPLDIGGIAKLCSITIEEATDAVNELKKRRVFSETRDKIIYSRRLVREDNRREASTKGGKTRVSTSARNKQGKFVSLDSSGQPAAQPPTQVTNQVNGHVAPEVGTQPQRLEARVQRLDSKDQNPLTPAPSPAAARGPSGLSAEDTLWRQLRYDIVEAFEEANSPNPPDTSWIDIWRNAGRDPVVCLAVVKAGIKRKPSVNTLKYFDNSIIEEHDKAAAARAKPVVGVTPKAETDWEHHVAMFAKSGRMIWLLPVPRPDSPNCPAPVEILRRHLPEFHPDPKSSTSH